MKPNNVVVVLLDSLNRHMLGCYGGDEFETPHLDRFAARSVQFENHYVGSLPCIPARHDLLCGSWDFLWRPWGSIELWEESITASLRRQGVTTMLCSDHPHLFETGGENYHTDFSAWNYSRGHENDPWKTRPDPSATGTPALPAGKGHGHRYDVNRTWFRKEEDYPGPHTMIQAADWLQTSAACHDRFLLLVDEFDPHEPFDTPAPWANRYDPDWQGELIIWPPYAADAVATGKLTHREARHIRANYGAKLSMIDHWFGHLMSTLDELDLWQNTAVILCTDHGHYLGEKDLFGKPGVPHYQPLAHIPLMMYLPGVAAGHRQALTTTVDIHATLADIFEAGINHVTHGHSLLPLLQGEANEIRSTVLAGVFGRWVHLIAHQPSSVNGDSGVILKYARGPVTGSNLPLSLWSNRWSTMPVATYPNLTLPRPDSQAFLDHMPGSQIPVIRQPFQEGDMLPYWCLGMPESQHHLYNLTLDPQERRNLADSSLESTMQDLLRAELNAVQAPDDQFERLGL